jgi:pimeloyl-ACP methyl ester carboxylesterase
VRWCVIEQFVLCCDGWLQSIHACCSARRIVGTSAHWGKLTGKPEGLTRDDILDNVTLYWLTNTAISSARLYWDTAHNLPAGGFFDVRGIKIPVAVSAFAEEIYQAPKSWAEKAYPKLIHYNSIPKGTHFAAWERPKLFVDEMRASFKSLR